MVKNTKEKKEVIKKVDVKNITEVSRTPIDDDQAIITYSDGSIKILFV